MQTNRNFPNFTGKYSICRKVRREKKMAKQTQKLDKFIIFLLVIFTVVFAYSVSPAGEKDLPPAPQGFFWKWCEAIKAGFLMPDGWFFKEEWQGETKAIFITKESIEKEVMFKTGLSVNVIQNAEKKTGIIPSAYAKNFIDNIQSKIQSWGLNSVGDGVYFKGYGVFSRSESRESGSIVQYTLIMGNDIKGTLYIIIFESPEVSWDENWKTGNIIIDNLALESEF